jgi:GT2 family glycosyltransferase
VAAPAERDPVMAPTVAIVNHNGGADLADCLASVRDQTLRPVEVVVVDNRSTDDSERQVGGARLLRLEQNVGYGGGANAAAAATVGDPLVILNPDVSLRPDWLATVAAAFEADPRLGVAGSKLLYPDGRTVQHAGGIVRPPLMLADHRRYGQPDDPAETEPVDVDYVTGAALALRRAALAEVGGFDEGFFLYFEETDLCRRARDAGWHVRYLPRAAAIHRESAVVGRQSSSYYRHYHRGRLRYALKHLTPARFLVDFVPAERARLPTVVSPEELLGLRHAYVDHACLLERADPLLAAAQPELRPALAEALAALAERAVAAEPTGLLAAKPVDALSELARLEPRPFRSRLPGVATFRSAWNWMSTRWYVAPILDQQSDFNRLAAGALARVESRLSALEQRLVLQAALLAEIDRDLVALARRVAAATADDPGGSAGQPPGPTVAPGARRGRAQPGEGGHEAGDALLGGQTAEGPDREGSVGRFAGESVDVERRAGGG